MYLLVKRNWRQAVESARPTSVTWRHRRHIREQGRRVRLSVEMIEVTFWARLMHTPISGCRVRERSEKW